MPRVCHVKAIWHDACAKKGELNCDFHAVWLEWRKRMRVGSKATRQAIKTHMKRLRVTDTVEQFIERIHQCTDGFLESFPEGTEPRPIPADLVWEAVKRAIEQRGFYSNHWCLSLNTSTLSQSPWCTLPQCKSWASQNKSSACSWSST